MVFVLSYCIYFMMVCCHFLETCCFLVGDLNQVDPDERRGAEKLWEVEGGELYLDYIVLEENLD